MMFSQVQLILKSVQFSVDGDSDKFRVTSQSEPISWPSESTQTITWDVSNTNQAHVNCSNVDIYLSRDAGRNFDMLLADDVSNDGSHDKFLIIK